jgi:hypothetical protein
MLKYLQILQIHIVSFLVDIYAFARMMKTFDPSIPKRKCATTGRVRVGICHAGDYHIWTYIRWLRDRGFLIGAESDKSPDDVRCVNFAPVSTFLTRYCKGPGCFK